MKKHTIATIAASGLAALSIGLAAPAIAAPSGPIDNTNGTSQTGTTANANSWLDKGSKTPYGTYQNQNSRHSR